MKNVKSKDIKTYVFLVRSSERIFFSRVNVQCCLLFGVRSNPMLPQWPVKDPGHSAKSAGGRLHETYIHP